MLNETRLVVFLSGWVGALAVAAAGAQTVRDSGGVQIIESRAPALAAAKVWRVDPKPTLVIGDPATTTGDSLYEFSRIMGVVRLSDGRIAVGNQGSSSVRFFDAKGRFSSASGRKGQGPGEFTQIMGLAVTRADTIVVMDNREVEYLSGQGAFIRQGASMRSASGRFIFPGAVFTDGSYAGIDWNERTIPPAGRAIRTYPLYHVSADGHRLDTLAVVPAHEAVFDGRSTFGAVLPFTASGLLASAGDRLLYSFPLRAEFTEFRRDGQVERVFRLNVPATPTTAADRDAYRNHVLSSPGEDGRPMPPQMRARAEARLDQAVFRGEYPVYGTMMSDRSGNLWARRFDFRERLFRAGPLSTITISVPTRWDVIDPSGRWLCTVELPANFTPGDIGNDYVAGVARDADDVEMVRVYKLVKP